MNLKNIFVLFALFCNILIHAQDQKTIRIIDKALFWDGYARDTIMKDTPDVGLVRFSTSLFARKINLLQLYSFGDSLKMKVTIKASCDNYDRIGYVGLAFVPKNQVTYDRTIVKRMEIARFITPFMNKNLKPDTVPYDYDLSNLIPIFKDRRINDSFDFWIELSVFGVPYAANTQVAGCSGRKDVFYGTLDLITNNTITVLDTNNFITPLMYNFNFNNYQNGASDSIGVNTKTIKFSLTDSISNAIMYLITSNHGADSAGEEYNRRMHYVYFDDTLVSQYKPGFQSCEPYRKYNTQGNGIYGSSLKTDAQWQSFSNWCPGAYIPIRNIALGNLSKGIHEFKLSVPDALFVKKSGYFPLSLYIQGKKVYKLSQAEANIQDSKNVFSVYPNPSTDHNVTIDFGIISDYILSIYSLDGKLIYNTTSTKQSKKLLNLHSIQRGVYILKLESANKLYAQKLILE